MQGEDDNLNQAKVFYAPEMKLIRVD